MTKEKIKSTEHEKDQIAKVLFIIGIGLLIGIIATNIKADQIVHKFKSPSFNGIGT